jgi:hypothetical protein
MVNMSTKELNFFELVVWFIPCRIIRNLLLYLIWVKATNANQKKPTVSNQKTSRIGALDARNKVTN